MLTANPDLFANIRYGIPLIEHFSFEGDVTAEARPSDATKSNYSEAGNYSTDLDPRNVKNFDFKELMNYWG